jgi:small subunit ribosomal protein S16
MLKIRLTRRGKKKQPVYRIVVAEHTMPVKGKFIEMLGFYNPRSKEIGLNKEKIEKWLKNGAKPSDTVAMLLKKNNIKVPEEFQKAKKYVKAKKEKKEKEKEEKPTKPEIKKEGEEVSETTEGKVSQEEKPKEESKEPKDEKKESSAENKQKEKAEVLDKKEEKGK